MPISVQLSKAELTYLGVLGMQVPPVESATMLMDLMDGRTIRSLPNDRVRCVYMAVRKDGGTDMIPGLTEYPVLRQRLADMFKAAGCYDRGRIVQKRPAPGTMDRVRKVYLEGPPRPKDEALAVRTFPEAWQPADASGTVYAYQETDTGRWYLYHQS